MATVIDINDELNKRYLARLERTAAKMVLSEREKAFRDAQRKASQSYKNMIGAAALGGWIAAGNGRQVEEDSNG